MIGYIGKNCFQSVKFKMAADAFTTQGRINGFFIGVTNWITEKNWFRPPTTGQISPPIGEKNVWLILVLQNSL